MPSLPSKRPKEAAGDGKIPTLTLEEVKALGTDLLSSREHINNLPRLLRVLSPSSPPQLLLESLLALHSFFLTLLPDIPSRSCSKPLRAGDRREPEELYREWLRNRFDEFLDSLITVAASPHSEDAILDVMLDVIMDFVKKGKGGKFESAIYHRFMHGLVYATSNVDTLLNLLAEKFFNYVDVRYVFDLSASRASVTVSTK